MTSPDFNRQIEIDQIPKIEEVEMISLEKDYLSVLLISRSISFFIMGAIIVVLMFVAPFEILPDVRKLVFAVFFIYVFWTTLSTIIGFRYKSYAMRDKDLVYKRGWLWSAQTTAPFNRVQHVKIDQGPLERQYQLAKLKVFTAGGSSSDLTIPGLTKQRAESLKEYIINRVKKEEE